MRHTLPLPLVLLLLGASLVLTACGSAPSTPIIPTLLTPAGAGAITDSAQIVGVWQVYDPNCSPAYMLIRPDGTYIWSCKPDGSDGLAGKYHFSNGEFVVLNDQCGAQGQYRVNAAGDNPRALTFTVVSDGCTAEIQTLTGQKLTWVSALP